MDISPFLQRKLARRFDTFDTNRDGSIDRADFESACDRLAAAFHLAPEAPALKHMRELSDVNSDVCSCPLEPTLGSLPPAARGAGRSCRRAAPCSKNGSPTWSQPPSGYRGTI
ncbi:hypothetical protein ACFWUW_33510 [Streptomyces sp. NPDC058655]|uniref:hypothetical protein n=1 Tax=Streptomyces sp. NPDC058655 TaxID=3346577 RepID=UPI003650DD14